MYIPRHIEDVIDRTSKSKGVIILTGARQVGKSTMLMKRLPDNKYISLDIPSDYLLAKESPTAFFNKYNGKVIIDEIQRAPELFHPIKADIDKEIFADLEEQKKTYAGKYILTGSQSYRLMKNVTESLAGRAHIIEMMGLSKREHNRIDYKKPFMPTEEQLREKEKVLKVKYDYEEIIEKIHKGSFPEMYQGEKEQSEWSDFFGDYIKSYIEKDVREIIHIQNEVAFYKFLRAVAALSGQQLNYSTLADMVGKDVMTMKSWLSMLVASGLVYLLEPYFNNTTQRMIKTPKLYMLDTGLICYLGGWDTSKQMANGAMWGAIFESYVVGEIIKSYYNSGITIPRLYYYRDKEKREVDMIIEQAGAFYPIEIKATTDPSKEMCTNFDVLSKIADIKVSEGAVICMTEKSLPLKTTVWAINVNQI